MAAIMEYEVFAAIFNEVIFEKSKADLLEKSQVANCINAISRKNYIDASTRTLRNFMETLNIIV